MENIKAKNLIASIFAMLKYKKWVLGTALGILGGIPYFLALQISGITLVQPLLNFGFIVMVYYANKWFNEKLDRSAIIGIIILIIMPVLIAFGDVSNPIMPQSRTSVYIYIGIISIIIVLSFLFAKKFPLLWAVGCGLSFSLGALATQALSLPLDFSSFDALINSALHEWDFIIFSTIFNSIGMFVGQIGIQQNPASKYNPINQTLNNISSFLGGVIVFSQHVSNIIIYSAGFLLGIIGVVLIAKYDINKISIDNTNTPDANFKGSTE
ncbi:MAG: hypothetical protein ACTSU2_08480 [Promethearchaeota archaeon]